MLDDDKLFIRELETSRDLFSLSASLVTSIHPTIVPSECRPAAMEDESRFILFIKKKGVGARTGRVVASKCDPYYVWGALVPVRLARFSTIQECMQTLGKMWTPGTW